MAIHRGRAFWSRHVAACARSGLSRAAYGRQHGLDYGTLRRWARRLAAERSEAAEVQALVPLRVSAILERSEGELRLEVGAGVMLAIADDAEACRIDREVLVAADVRANRRAGGHPAENGQAEAGGPLGSGGEERERAGLAGVHAQDPGALSPEVALYETVLRFGQGRIEMRDLKHRYLAEVATRRPLSLTPLAGPASRILGESVAVAISHCPSV